MADKGGDGKPRDAKEICAAMETNPQMRDNMTAAEFEARIVEWARTQTGLKALVLGGSRAKSAGRADHLSDWDFHLITSRPRDYHNTGWLEGIAPCWCAHAARTPRGFVKVSAIFARGFEADFVPLAAWQMKLVYAGMWWPNYATSMPARLRRGIQETRAFMLGSGYRLLAGDPAWIQRFAALEIPWPQPELTWEEFAHHLAAFWPKAVWIFKKIARPEPRAAVHWLHLLVVYQVYPLLAEEARLAGREPRPEARKAEQWLDARRLAQTDITTGTDPRGLAQALLSVITLFEEAARSVAESRGFKPMDHSAVAAWLRAELAKLAD